MEKGKLVKVIGGNNEIGQTKMIGKVGVITSIGEEYFVKGKKTREINVNFEHFGGHSFNDYHLEPITK